MEERYSVAKNEYTVCTFPSPTPRVGWSFYKQSDRGFGGKGGGGACGWLQGVASPQNVLLNISIAVSLGVRSGTARLGNAIHQRHELPVTHNRQFVIPMSAQLEDKYQRLSASSYL